jgi:DNA-binding NarL/FixJ family response regulator
VLRPPCCGRASDEEVRVPIAVAIVEDNADYRMGLACLLRTSPSLVVQGEYGSAEAFFKAASNTLPDVVLMDLALPGMSGSEAIGLLRERFPRVGAVVLSVHDDGEHVFQAICAGAVGYLTKPVTPSDLIESVESAFGGGTPMSPQIARQVLEMFRSYAPPRQADYNLTEREVAVLERLVDGDGCKEIGDALFISVYTVRAHLRNIYDKLHVHSKTQAVSKALRERLLHRK